MEHALQIRPAEESGLRRANRAPQRVGRYLVSAPIARGGMASVHLAVVADEPAHIYALKRIHPHLAHDDYFQRMLRDETSIACAIQHPNVIATYGSELVDGEMFLLMEYVTGLSLSDIARAWNGPLPPHYAAAIVAGALRGLHAAHEAYDGHGRALHVVHRDVSPTNIMVGIDGLARVFDFGIASAAHRVQTTRAGTIKGKLSYMAPEQVLGAALDRRIDIYAAGVVLWEALTGSALFNEENDAATLARVLENDIVAPRRIVEDIPRQLDAIVMRALSKDPARRFGTALEMARALEMVLIATPVSLNELGQWVTDLGDVALAKQEDLRDELQGRPSFPSPDALALLPPLLPDEPELAPTTIRPSFASVPAVAAPAPRPFGDVMLVFALVIVSALGGALVMHLGTMHHWRLPF